MDSEVVQDVVILDQRNDDPPNSNDESTLLDEDQSKSRRSRYLKLLAVKPVLIIYGIQYCVQGSVTTQLWLDKICYHQGYNETVCTDLTNPANEQIEAEVQKRQVTLSIIESYLAQVPGIFITLYLGPWSDQGRKPLMVLPFIGHIISGTVYLLNIWQLKTSAPEWLFLADIYVLFGGYLVLNIALNGYISDLTLPEERTTIMAVLAGLGFIVFPFAELISGQLYRFGGFFLVYGVSLGFSIVGVIYVFFIPETVMARRSLENPRSKTSASMDTPSSPPSLDDKNAMAAHLRTLNLGGKFKFIFNRGNRLVWRAIKMIFKQRDEGLRRILIFIVGIRVGASLSSNYANTLLFTERVFGWDVVQYTTYTSVFMGLFVVKTFVTTPFYSYLLGMHDAMLASIGALVGVGTSVVQGFSTQGWMFYYGAGLTVLGPMMVTSLDSLASKCVDTNEFGQMFTIFHSVTSVAGLLTSSAMSLLYQKTVESFPGASFLLSASLQAVTTVLCVTLFGVILRHEKRWGPIGATKKQDQVPVGVH